MTEDQLISSLHNAGLYDHPVEAISVLETHISWVVLTGAYAYKIKKPVNFGFLDFSTLEKRHYFCHEELRLNRRLAPELYLDVIAITGTRRDPCLCGPGRAIEYAVKMRQFAQEALLSEVSARGELEPQHIDQIAQTIAGFHQRAEIAAASTPFGLPDRVHHFVVENLEQIHPYVHDQPQLSQLSVLAQWSEDERRRRREQIQARKDHGFVRECHGDMHLGNMALLSGRVTPFDCLEFNKYLRWIDVLSEAAFVAMDLRDRGHPRFAWRFLNRYLQATGDYGGVVVLRYYLVYRALVRAKVALLRLAQGGFTAVQRADIWREYQGYADLAQDYAHERRPALIVTHGVSGTGKSTLATQLVETMGALQLRSDVERKRLFGFQAAADTKSGLRSGIYLPEASRKTYEYLAELVPPLVQFGCPIIIDATFIKRAERDRFRRLAAGLEIPFLILDFQAPEAVLRDRVAGRRRAQHDASEADVAVLEHQLRACQPLSEEELDSVLMIHSDAPTPADALSAMISDRLRIRT